MPRGAFTTPQHVPWCPQCARHHNGACEDTDVTRDNSPTVNVNLRGVADDGELGTGFDSNGLRVDSGIVDVTDGTTMRASRAKRRETCFGLDDTVCTRADGSTYVIPRKKDRRDAKRATKRTIAEVKLTEATILALREREKLGADEIRALNGL